MELELIGETPTYLILIKGITPVRAKRAASIILKLDIP
jgi:hypothetical protein